MPIIKFNGADLCWEEAGSGPPLILVPGFASGAWSWSWQVPELSRSFRVITFDPRGISRSKLQDGASVSIELIADDISGLLNAADAKRANVLGISFGGFVAQEFALKYPDKVDNLVLASTSFGGPNHVLPSPETLASFAEMSGLNTAERIRNNLVLAFTGQYAAEHGQEIERFCSLREQNPLSEDVYRQQLASAIFFNAESRLGGLLARTLVLGGDHDTVVPFANSVNLSAAVPNAKLSIIEKGGHMAFIEQAAEFNSIVTNFLNRQ